MTLVQRYRAARARNRMHAMFGELDAHLLRDIGLLEAGEPPVAAIWRPRLERRLAWGKGR